MSIGGQPTRGFSLAEALVALALIAVTLSASLFLIIEEPRIDRRLRAHAEALEALEWALETGRAGGLPTGLDGPIPLEALFADRRRAADEILVTGVTTSLSARGLFHVSLVARYRLGGRWHRRTLESYLWRPQR